MPLVAVVITSSEKGEPEVSVSENNQLTVFLNFRAPCKKEFCRYCSKSSLS